MVSELEGGMHGPMCFGVALLFVDTHLLQKTPNERRILFVVVLKENPTSVRSLRQACIQLLICARLPAVHRHERNDDSLLMPRHDIVSNIPLPTFRKR